MDENKLLKLTESQEERAQAIYDSAIVIDALNYSPTLPSLGHPEYLEEYSKAGVTATHFTIHLPYEGLRNLLNQVSLWYQLAEGTQCSIVESAKDIRTAKEKRGKCIIFGIQNGKPLEENVSFVRIFHKLGIRIIQLAYNEQNLLGAGGDEMDAGVTKLGHKMIEEMNRVGILIDASHCGPQTTMDIIRHSEKPIAFTHANPRALCEHYRNKTDEQLKALAERGGVVGLTAMSLISKTHKDKRPALKDFLDFVDYTVNLVGVKHVGFGLDFAPIFLWDQEAAPTFARKYPGLSGNDDEISIEGLETPSHIIDIARGLVSRGYDDVEIRGILGENFLHLFEETWKQ